MHYNTSAWCSKELTRNFYFFIIGLSIGCSYELIETHLYSPSFILINQSDYVPAALLLLSAIHGRIGHFPTLIRMRPKHSSVTTYEVLELLNLQTIRDAARKSNNA